MKKILITKQNITDTSLYQTKGEINTLIYHIPSNDGVMWRCDTQGHSWKWSINNKNTLDKVIWQCLDITSPDMMEVCVNEDFDYRYKNTTGAKINNMN